MRYAEATYEVERNNEKLDVLAQLHSLLARLKSPLAHEARRRLSSRLEEMPQDEVSPESFQLYLALSLQGSPNLAAAQVATDLSPQAGAACLAELRSTDLISQENQVLSFPIAAFYLEQHVEEKMALLRALADSTPTEQALPIFQKMFEMSHTFGGIGYWDKARAAYYSGASALAEAQDFQAAADILGQLQEAEVANRQPPHPESRALRAYAVGQLTHYHEGLAVLADVTDTPEVMAVKAALSARVGDYDAAKVFATAFRDAAVTPSADTRWLGALNTHTLAQVAHQEARLRDTEIAFAQASAAWLVAGQPHRELEALLDRAKVLGQLGHFENALNVCEKVLAKSGQ